MESLPRSTMVVVEAIPAFLEKVIHKNHYILDQWVILGRGRLGELGEEA
jgi:hypothetical protein